MSSIIEPNTIELKFYQNSTTMIEINTWCKFQVSLGYKFGNLIFSHTNKYKITFMELVFVQKQKNVNSCKNDTEKDHHSFFSDASL